jgi:diguanylate cyclase (GGDEF)-like protein
MQRVSISAEQTGIGESRRSLTPEALARRSAQRRSTYIAQGVSYVIDAVILLLYYLAGTTTLASPVVYLGCGIASTSIALFLSEIHFNDRFKDHYLTVPQSITSTTIQLVAIYLAPEVGFYFVCINFIILGFGSLRITARQTAFIWTYSTVGLSILFLMTDRPIAMPMSTWAERALALACFVTALGRCASTGLYGSTMREALYQNGNELRRAYARIEELVDLDELTGVLNRRRIMKTLDEEIARAQRGKRPCSVAMIDLDLFKRINDRFGHPVGDEVLRSFGIAMFANIRTIDTVGRYGGEEFLLILPDTASDGATRTLDRLRVMVSQLDWLAISPNLTVTMSAGVATIRQGDTADSLLARADEALYRAKDAGRNCVVAESPGVPSPAVRTGFEESLAS